MLRVYIVVAALLTLCGVGAASGQPEPRPVRALVDQAVDDFKAGRYEEALEGFQRANVAGAPPTALFMVGRCHQMMEEWQEARDAFTAFLAAGGLAPTQRARGEAELRAVEARLSKGTLVIQVSPFGATVFVDGRPVGEAPVEPFEVAVGRHEVRAAADGYLAVSRTVEVKGAERTLVAIELFTEPPAPALTDTPAEPPSLPEPVSPPEQPSYSPWTWITLGTGIALVAGGTASYVLGELDHRQIVDSDGYTSGGTVDMTRARALSLEGSGDTKKLVGYVLWGAGGAALVTSTVLFVLDATSGVEETGGVSVGASTLPGGGFLSLQGRF